MHRIRKQVEMLADKKSRLLLHAVGVDPGTATGSMAVIGFGYDKPFHLYEFSDLPTKKLGDSTHVAGHQLATEYSRCCDLYKPTIYTIERLAPRGMMAKMMVGYGMLSMIPAIYDIPLIAVPPPTWKKWAGVLKSDDAAVREQVLNLFSFESGVREQLTDAPKTLWPHRADAALIGAYGLVQHRKTMLGENDD